MSSGYSKDLAPGDIVKLASMGVYTSLLYEGPLDRDRAKQYSEIIHALTRIFPDSSSSGVEELGLVFIHPNPSVPQDRLSRDKLRS